VAAPDISVVVVSWRTRELTLACLASLAADAARSGLDVETVLVDNASGDGTVEAVAAAFPAVRVVASGANLGFAAGCNRGLAIAGGRHVLLLNPDAEVPAGTLGALAGFLDATPRAGAVGCRLVSPSGAPQFSAGRFLTPFNQFAETIGLGRILPAAALRRSYRDDELEAEAVEVDWVVGACLAVRRAALDEVGPLDERFFMYSEDEDLCYRLRSAGWTVHLLTRVRVRHVGGGSAAQALGPMREAARASQTAFVRKHMGAGRAALFRILMRVAALKPSREPDRVGWGQRARF
jgi:N-acetylglucosaminyl-diphospho-decaprenol L-rhamnosyltransferase